MDTTLFFAFLTASVPAFTGLPVHEWLSLALAGTLLVHLLLHWKWVLAVTAQFFRNLFHSTRLNYLIDLLTLLAFVMVMLSGVLISRSVLPALGLQSQVGGAWRMLHSFSANAALVMVGLHFALHWKWIVSAVRRHGMFPVFRRPQPLTPVAVRVEHKPGGDL